MTWAKIDDNMTDGPDLLGLSRSDRLVYVEALVWCCRHLTDGAIARHALRRLTDADAPEASAAALVEAGLWEVTDAGWRIVDFHKTQRSREEIEKQRAATYERQKAYLRRGRLHKAGDHSECTDRCPQVKASNGQQAEPSDASRDGVSDATPVQSRPDPARPVPQGKGRGRGGRDSGPDGGRDAPPGGSAPSHRRPAEAGGKAPFHYTTHAATKE